MNRSRKAALAGLVLLPALAGGFAFESRANRNGAELLDQVLTFVAKRYVDSLGAESIYERTARGLVKELADPYTELFSPKQLADFQRGTIGHYAGLGMEINPINGWVTAGKIFPGSPAERGGVMEGDRIARIDTANTYKWSNQQVQNLLLGEPGTNVTVTFNRPGVPTPITKTFKRAVIHVSAVPYAMMLDDRVGYVPVQRFSEQVAAEVDSSVRALVKRGAKGIILDLRGNGGGIVDEALAMSNIFLPPGKLLLTVKTRTNDERSSTTAPPTAPDVPLIILTDGGTASASEIVAGALQDYDRALILGTTSFGKGLVQSVYPLDGGYALKMTTGKWYTPSGRSIQKERKLLADGEFVEVRPDSLETDSVRNARPKFKSESGRTVFGGGAITPDVIMASDTISTAEQQLARLILPKFGDFYGAISAFGLEQKGKVPTDFKVTPAWNNEIFTRLQAVGVTLDRAKYDAGVEWVDRYLEQNVARTAYGDTTAKRHAMDDDSQLLKAIQLLHQGNTQKELFVAASHVTAQGVAKRPGGAQQR